MRVKFLLMRHVKENSGKSNKEEDEGAGVSMRVRLVEGTLRVV